MLSISFNYIAGTCSKFVATFSDGKLFFLILTLPSESNDSCCVSFIGCPPEKGSHIFRVSGELQPKKLSSMQLCNPAKGRTGPHVNFVWWFLPEKWWNNTASISNKDKTLRMWVLVWLQKHPRCFHTRPWTERANMFFGFHGGMSVLAAGEPKSRSAVSEEDGYGYAVSTVSCVMFVAGASRSKVHDHAICLRAPLDCAVFSMQHQPGKNQNLEPFQPRCCPAPQYLCWCQSFDPHSAITCWCTARETHTQAHNMLFWFETLGCFGMRHASYLGLIGFLVMACLADTALHVWVSQEPCSLCSRNWVIETITEQTQPVRPSFKAGSNCFCSCRVLKHCARMITYVLPRW